MTDGDFRSTFLDRARIEGKGCTINAELSHLTARNSEIMGLNIYPVNLANALVESCKLVGCKFLGGGFRNSIIEGADELEDANAGDICMFSQCSFQSMKFIYTELNNVYFNVCSFSDKLIIEGTKINKTILSNPVLSELDEISIVNSDLSGLEIKLPEIYSNQPDSLKIHLDRQSFVTVSDDLWETFDSMFVKTKVFGSQGEL